MKYYTAMAAWLCAGIMFFCIGASGAWADGICQKKIANIQRQIDIAKQHDNMKRVAGLERALEKTRAWCTDDGELAEAEIEVMEKQEKVQERQVELDKAIARDKQESKVAKRKHKLQEAQKELQEAEKARDALKAGK